MSEGGYVVVRCTCGGGGDGDGWNFWSKQCQQLKLVWPDLWHS